MLPFPNPQAAGGRYQYTTWNPADLSNITLSNGNLTGLQTAAGSSGVRGTTTRSTGKRGLTFTLQNGSNIDWGIANAAATLTGTAANDTLWYSGFKIITVGNTAISGALAAVTSSSVIDMLFDFSAKLIWVRVDGGSWNNNPANDPAAGTGGVSFSTLNAGPYYPWFATNGAGLGVTLNPYAGGYPAGFTPWDGQ